MLPLLALAQSSQTSLVVAEQMPYFEGCEDYEDGSEEKRNCSNINLVNFISENIQYPEDANTKGIEGTVFLSFVVTKMAKSILRKYYVILEEVVPRKLCVF